MSLTEGRKWLLFIALASVLLFSLLFQREVANRSQKNAPVLSEARGRNVDKEEVPSLDLLTKRNRLNAAVKRNIFQFREGYSIDSLPDGRPLAEKQQPTDPVPVRPTAPNVRYLGFYQEKGSSEAKLAAISNGGQIYVGGVGEVLAGKYEVLYVDDETLILRIVADGKVIRFPLGKESASELPESLKPAQKGQAEIPRP